MPIRIPPAAVAACLLVLAVLPRAAAARVFDVTGVVRSPVTNGRVVVTHQEIVGFMPAMTMGFVVAPAALDLAQRLQVGDRVRFKLHVDEDEAVADGFTLLGHAGEPEHEPAAPPRDEIVRLHVGDALPAFTLADEQDRPLTRAQLAGHVTVLTFIFTRCPMPEYCPLMAHRFAELQKAIVADPALAPRARLLSITLDPAFDRPAVLKAYGAAVGANEAIWNFGTGTPADIDRLVKAFSVYTERNGAILDHTLCTALVDSEGKIVELWRGNGWTIGEVLDALRRAR